MIKHIVLFTLRPHAAGRSGAENAALMKARLEELNGRIPGLLRLEVGIDISRTDSSADVALYSEFESREALDVYQAHAEHVAIAEFVAQVRDGRIVVDYEI